MGAGVDESRLGLGQGWQKLDATDGVGDGSGFDVMMMIAMVIIVMLAL